MQAPRGEWWGLSQPVAGVSAELGQGGHSKHRDGWPHHSQP